MRRLALSACLIAVLLVSALALSGCGAAFLGNKYTYTYHDPSCIWAEEMSSGSKVKFGSVAEAEEAGYEPCDTCNPTESE